MKSTSGIYPLSSVQKEIWFDQVLHPDIPLYNIGGYLRIDGPVDRAVFEKAVDKLIDENDALRTILHEGDPLPVQEIVDKPEYTLAYMDFSGRDNAMDAAVAWLQDEFVKPFSLYGAPLFQFALIKVSDTCYCWLNKNHHLITDGCQAPGRCLQCRHRGKRQSRPRSLISCIYRRKRDLPGFQKIREERELLA